MADTPGTIPVSDVTKSTAPAATQSTPQTTPTETKPVEQASAPVGQTPITPTTVISQATSNATLDEHIGYLNDYLRRYLEIHGGILRTDDQRKQAIALLADIMRHVLRYPTPAILNRMFEFFKEQRSQILVPHLALQGLGHVSDAMMKKVAVLHTVFYELTSATPGTLNLSYATEVLENQQLIAWVATKMKSLKK